MEQKKKKGCVEEGVKADDSEYEEETTSDVKITMDTDGPGIDPYTRVIHPDMFLTYAYADDGNSKSDSNSNYEPEDNDDNVLEKKTSGWYFYLLCLAGSEYFVCCKTGKNLI